MKKTAITLSLLFQSASAFANGTHEEIEIVPEPSAYVAWTVIGVIGVVIYWRNRSK